MNNYHASTDCINAIVEVLLQLSAMASPCLGQGQDVSSLQQLQQPWQLLLEILIA